MEQNKKNYDKLSEALKRNIKRRKEAAKKVEDLENTTEKIESNL